MQVSKDVNLFMEVAEDALWRIDLNAHQKTQYLFQPKIFHPNVRLFMTTVDENAKESAYSVVYHEFQNDEDTGFWPGFYPLVPMSHIYIYALLNWEQEKYRPGSFFVGKGDGEPGVIKGNAAAVLHIEQTSRQPGTRDLKAYTANTVKLPMPPYFDTFYAERYLLSLGLEGSQGFSFSFEQPVSSGRSAIQKNTSIHVIDTGFSKEGHKKLLSVLRTEEDDGCLFGGEDPFFGMLAAFIHPDPEGQDDYVFQLGDPEKDGKIKLTAF
jgi:hypothetical protein